MTNVDLLELIVTVMAVIIRCNHFFRMVIISSSAVVWKPTVT